ncbi:MAG: hypothetical protein GEV04_16200 [Actinophytocola sp.]|nr:hypothetical protein [Actinophytocola sp.]
MIVHTGQAEPRAHQLRAPVGVPEVVGRAARAGRLAELVMPVTMAVVGAGILPQRSTLGLGT